MRFRGGNFAFFTKVLIQCKKYSKKQQNIKKILYIFWCFCYNENATQKRFYIDFNNHDYKKGVRYEKSTNNFAGTCSLFLIFRL